MLDARLAADEYLAGEFSIADIACFPWTRVAAGHGVDIKADFPHVARWMSAIGQRPSAKVRIDDPREARAGQNSYTAEQFQTLFRPAAGTVGPAGGEAHPDAKESNG